jgi:hypothetical protein
MDSVTADLATTPERGSEALYSLLAERLTRDPSFDLLTVLAPHAAGDRLVRLFTSNAGQFPLGDADPVEDNRWFRQLFVERRPVIANDGEEIRAWLPAFNLPMGYGSLANIPVFVLGEAVGVVNLMASSGHFSTDRVAAVLAQTPLAALAIFSRDAPLCKINLAPRV